MRTVSTWFRRGLFVLGAVASVLVVALVGMFAYLQVQSRQPVTLPRPTGRYAVGRAIYDWTEASRIDPFSPPPRSTRELSVWVWYPARVPQGATRAPYLSPAWQHAFQGDDFLHTRADAVRTHSWVDAPVAETGAPLPVLVFQPGFGRIAADYSSLAEDLASHGYVVFGVNPTYLSDAVVLGGGRVVDANRMVARGVEANPSSRLGAQVTEVEARDLLFVATRVQRLDRGSGRFQDRLAWHRVGFFGHSIGGSGATRACQLDPRCAGAVNLDGFVFGPVVTEGVGKPYLFLGEDPALNPVPTANLRGVVRDLPADQARVLTVRGAGHMNFSDLGVMYKFPPDQLGAIGPIDGTRGIAITRDYLLTFFSAHLRDRTVPLPRYPEVQAVNGFD